MDQMILWKNPNAILGKFSLACGPQYQENLVNIAVKKQAPATIQRIPESICMKIFETGNNTSYWKAENLIATTSAATQAKINRACIFCQEI